MRRDRHAQDFKTNTGHGKLLLDDNLYPEAYATNVNEQVRAHATHSPVPGCTTALLCRRLVSGIWTRG